MNPSKGEGYEAHVGRIARGASIGTFGQGVGRVLNFTLQVALARFYGPAQLGFYVLGLTVVQIANILSQFGMDNGVVRYVARYRAEGDVARVRGTVIQALLATFVLSLVFSALVFFGAGFLAEGVFRKPFLETMFQVFSLAVPFLTLMSMTVWATQGFRTVKYATYVQYIGQPLVNLVFVLVFYLLGVQILGAAAAYILSLVAGSVLALYFLRRVFPELLDRGVKPKYESRAFFGYSGPMTVATVSNQINSWTATTVLGIFATAGAVGVYNVASRTAALSTLVLLAFNGIFSPMISDLYSKGSMQDLDRLYRDVSRWSFTGAFAIFVLTVVLARDIMAVFGREFVYGWPVIVVVAAAQLLNSSVGPTGRMLAMTGHHKLVMVATTSATVTGIAASVALVPPYGVMGAAAATVAGVLVFNVVKLYGIVKRLHLWPYDRKYYKPLSAGLVAAGVIFAIGLLLPLPDGLPTVMVLGPIFGLIFAAILLGLGLSSSDRLLLSSFWTAVRNTTGRSRAKPEGGGA